MFVYNLKNKLDEIGVPPDLYSILTGGLLNERLCIVREGLWQVYYSEHGKKAGQKFFEAEEEACEYFCDKMKRYADANRNHKWNLSRQQWGKGR
ncbi:hypothetical protein [uncultured Intestinimonas sp.]|uniref:hypothetical protein n=1 Tax=uncultured Intestinimonas sp. TaxID=1689265 RepID=UPI0025FA4CC7|nr:hypothetical protein [uncultured Intestinimonas sp.]